MRDAKSGILLYFLCGIGSILLIKYGIEPQDRSGAAILLVFSLIPILNIGTLGILTILNLIIYGFIAFSSLLDWVVR